MHFKMMRNFLPVFFTLASFQFVSSSSSAAFVHRAGKSHLAASKTSSKMSETPNNEGGLPPCTHPFTQLPGDPSLLLVTNMDLGDKKLEVMKACSKAISTATGKPESYIGVSITDNASVIFGGSDEPCALGNMVRGSG
jgi:hypothetical protein